MCAEEYWKRRECGGKERKSQRNVVQREVRIVYKAVVLKRFWSHNQSRRASTKEWAFKRKLSACVCVFLEDAEEEENGEGQFRMRVRSASGRSVCEEEKNSEESDYSSINVHNARDTTTTGGS